MEDRRTFDRLLRWTTDNLQAGDPSRLPAWKWGQRPDGSWGVLDALPASDADTWMAWALILAHRRFGGRDHLERARALVTRIWSDEVVEHAGRHILLPGPWAKGGEPLRLNPSYWLPFAWRAFATMDAEHPWPQLVDDVWGLWGECMQPSGLPPDWCYLDASGRPTLPPEGDEAHLNFGFEAFRVGWTLAAEERWSDEPRAAGLGTAFRALYRRWRSEGSLPGVLAPDGTAREDWDYLGMYGALLPLWGGRRAQQVYSATIAPRAAAWGWGEEDDYYSQNWVWFGLALQTGVAVPE
jgi:endoglucanase